MLGPQELTFCDSTYPRRSHKVTSISRLANMLNFDSHSPRALGSGVDLICAQGGEGGGHTGDTPFSILIPACVDLCKNARSPLTGQPVIVVAAGGIADGRGLAVSLAYGAAGVWVGTRFVAFEEAGAPPVHKELIVTAGYDDTVRTLIYTGRPLSVRGTPYVASWFVSVNHQSCKS